MIRSASEVDLYLDFILLVVGEVLQYSLAPKYPKVM